MSVLGHQDYLGDDWEHLHQAGPEELGLLVCFFAVEALQELQSLHCRVTAQNTSHILSIISYHKDISGIKDEKELLKLPQIKTKDVIYKLSHNAMRINQLTCLPARLVFGSPVSWP